MKKNIVKKKDAGQKNKKSVTRKSKKSNELSSMSFDDFVDTIGDDSSETSSGSETVAKNTKSGTKKTAFQIRQAIANGSSNSSRKASVSDSEDDSLEDRAASDGSENDQPEEDEEEQEDEASSDDSESGQLEEDVKDVASDEESSNSINASKKHKQDLSKLKDIDPEFYKYLQENDKKLLQFDVSDSEESESAGENSKETTQDTGADSDSEEDGDGAEDGGKAVDVSVITMKMVNNWRDKLVTDKTVQTINEVVQAFHAALQRVLPEDERDGCPYKVVGGAVFNAVVQLCVLDLIPAIQNYLKLPSKSWSHVQLQKSKHWVKVKTLVKSYLADLLQLLDGVASVNVTTILLKHLHQMCSFVPAFPNIAKKLLKKTISLWSSGEETVRVISFMCALKVTTSQQQVYLDSTLRYMYMAYINNTKFVSPTTLPGINFMRKSLAEMFLLDENVSYHHAFLYIRQLAIHLRNAINLHKKESIQAVYNWQFLASLALWVEVLGLSNKPALKPLLYPVVQVITGALKLVPTAQYFPLRFHYVRMLINLSRDTGNFVPTLPFVLEVLNSYDFNKKHTKVSMKPLDLNCILRVSKIQQQENGFKDAVIESIYNLLLHYTAVVSHSIAFPDLMIPVIVQLKSFLKKCKIPNYTKKMKQILEKIESNCRFIEKERKVFEINLTDSSAVENWETSVKVKGTPLMSFYGSWEKMNNLKESKQQVETLNVTEKASKEKQKLNRKGAEGPTNHLPSDDSDLSDCGDEKLSPKSSKRRQKTQKGANKKKAKTNASSNAAFDEDGEMEDVLEDVSIGDW